MPRSLARAGFAEVSMRQDLTDRDPGARRPASWVGAPMADELDVEAMLARFRDGAAVRDRPLPPVAGPDRQQFVEQAQLDFQDFAIVGDATWDFDDGVLTLRVDLGASDS